jgi:siderophore synthetase component
MTTVTAPPTDQQRSETAPSPNSIGATAHLTPVNLAIAQRSLVAKALAEFAHERILEPVREGEEFVLETPDRRTRYRFRGRELALENWLIDRDSLTRERDGLPADLDAQELIVEFAEVLGLPSALLPTYLEEIGSTLASTAWKLEHHRSRSADLVDADYQDVEAAMTEGHPGFVANNGRIGFGIDDYSAWAPESGRPVQLVWLACRRSVSQLSLGEGIDEADLYEGELDESVREYFTERLRERGLDPEDYLWLPLHPWQWTNKVAITFAPDLARDDLVHLGVGPDAYRPQQSIRTFFNVSRPGRHYVKTALSIQNMGFMRGLSPAYMTATPTINDWVWEVVTADQTLRRCGFSVLRERAAIGYTGDVFHQLGPSSPYQKMLAALWRESPVSRLEPGEQLATLAALLHRDLEGTSYAASLIARSALDPLEWLESFLRAHLRPLVHCLLAHDLAFMPHGENLIMVLRDGVPLRMLMKDIGEEVAVLGDKPLPEEAERIRHDVPADHLPLPILTDVFDGFLRHLAGILDEDGLLPEDSFWSAVRGCIEQHEADHPELAESAARYDLLRPEFQHSCLNRLQLRNTLEMVDLAGPVESMLDAGTLENPAARTTWFAV